MIRLQSVVKQYPLKGSEGALTALDRVDLHIPAGDYSALLGASGSGKSTLMNILGCLDVPTSGNYFLDGVNLASLSARKLSEIRRDKIGFIFQGFQLFRKLTALENVAYPLMLRGIPSAARRSLALDALASVGLSDRQSHLPHQLSGGQQQRVAIARALCYRPRLLLCDEPTGALDPESRDEILSLFQSLHQKGHTLVVITHDLGVAQHAKRRFYVRDGKISPHPS